MSDIDPIAESLRRLDEHARAAAGLPPSAQIRARATRRRARRHAAVAGMGALTLLAGVGAAYALAPRGTSHDRLVTLTNHPLPPTTTSGTQASLTAGPEQSQNPASTPSATPTRTATSTPVGGGSGSGPTGTSAPASIPATTTPGTTPTASDPPLADSRLREVTRVSLVGWASRGADETYLWTLVNKACGPLATLADQAQPAGDANNAVIRDGCLDLGERPVYLKVKLTPRGLLVATSPDDSLLSPGNPQTLTLSGFLSALGNLKLLDPTQTQPKPGAPSIPADITTDAQNVIVAVDELPSTTPQASHVPKSSTP